MQLRWSSLVPDATWAPISARAIHLSTVCVPFPACQESPWLCSLALSVLIPLCFHIEVVYPGHQDTHCLLVEIFCDLSRVISAFPNSNTYASKCCLVPSSPPSGYLCSLCFHPPAGTFLEGGGLYCLFASFRWLCTEPGSYVCLVNAC